jgi:hypothetical protein
MVGIASGVKLRGQVLNLDVSVFGFALNNRSQRFGVSLEMEMGQEIRESVLRRGPTRSKARS